MRKPTWIELVMLLGGPVLVAYNFFRLKSGDRVIVSTDDVAPPTPIKINHELLVEVLSISDGTVNAKVLAKVTGAPLDVSRIGMTVSFPKSAIRRRA